MKKIFMRKLLIGFLMLLFSAVPAAALADGGIFPSPDYWIYETDQKAVIVHENNVETLIVSIRFEGDAKDFAWIIPTPSQPEVDKAPFNIFESLEKLTQIAVDYGYIRPLGMESAVPLKRSVEVLEQKKVDIYEITVLKATDKNALYDWLKENDYRYPESGKYILDSYINNKWVFTAVKINAESLEAAENQLRQGIATPLRFVFNSSKIVYPLKISAVISEPPQKYLREGIDSGGVITKKIVPPYDPYQYQRISIQLYVFADHKKEAIGFDTQWANWVAAKKIEKLAFNDNGDPWYQPKAKKMFLTKLYRSMQVSQMKDDVFLIDAPDNKVIPPSIFWSVVLWSVLFFLILLISPFGLLYIIFLLLYLFIKSKTARIVFVVIQALISIGLIVFALILRFHKRDYYSTDSLVPANSFLIGSGALILLMIIGMILEIILGRKRRVG